MKKNPKVAKLVQIDPHILVQDGRPQNKAALQKIVDGDRDLQQLVKRMNANLQA